MGEQGWHGGRTGMGGQGWDGDPYLHPAALAGSTAPAPARPYLSGRGPAGPPRSGPGAFWNRRDRPRPPRGPFPVLPRAPTPRGWAWCRSHVPPRRGWASCPQKTGMWEERDTGTSHSTRTPPGVHKIRRGKPRQTLRSLYYPIPGGPVRTGHPLPTRVPSGGCVGPPPPAPSPPAQLQHPPLPRGKLRHGGNKLGHKGK